MQKTVTTPFHLVKPSIWPFLTSIFVFTMALYLAITMHYDFLNSSSVFLSSFCFLVWSAGSWWFDVCIEGFRGGYHTKKVKLGLRMGMALFIVSEVMFFFGFFWAFFASSLAPVFNIGGVWPPVGIHVIGPWGVPLLNTFILLLSGVTVTKAHLALQQDQDLEVVVHFLFTLVLAFLFTKLQVAEYSQSSFNISDSVYGSLFFLMTGFHGLHVFIGTCFLLVCFFRYESGHFTKVNHFGFEAAIWYWHFVDVVWIFLFICLYWWGGAL